MLPYPQRTARCSRQHQSPASWSPWNASRDRSEKTADQVRRASSSRSLSSAAARSRVWQASVKVRHLRGKRFQRLLQIGGVKLAQIPRHTPIDPRKAALHLRAGIVLIAVFDRFELAPVDPIATLAFVNRPICRQSATNWTQTYGSQAHCLCRNQQLFCDQDKVDR